MYDLSSARDGNKVSSHSLFLVSLDLAVIHLHPSSLLPPCSTHTCEQTLLCTFGHKPGADITSPGPAWRFPTAGVGSTCVFLLCVCCTQSQAGLVTICIGKAPASHEPPRQLLQAQSKPGHKAGILPYLRAPASCPWFSHTKTLIYASLSLS